MKTLDPHDSLPQPALSDKAFNKYISHAQSRCSREWRKKNTRLNAAKHMYVITH